VPASPCVATLRYPAAMSLLSSLLLIGSCATSSAFSNVLTQRAAVVAPVQTSFALHNRHALCPASRAGGGSRSCTTVLMHAAQPSSRVKFENRLVRRENIMRRLEPSTTPREPDGPPEDDPSTEMVLAIVRAADARKAKEICALRVGHLTSATSYFVNMQGSSKAQIQAIVKSIEDELDEQFSRSASRQGKAVGGWVCLDFDDVVVNVFSEKERAFYQIEKFWAAAQRLDLSGVVTPDFAPADSVSAAPREANHDDDGGDDVWALGDDDWLLDSGLDDIALAPLTDADAGAGADADADADADLLASQSRGDGASAQLIVETVFQPGMLWAVHEVADRLLATLQLPLPLSRRAASLLVSADLLPHGTAALPAHATHALTHHAVSRALAHALDPHHIAAVAAELCS